MKKWKWIHRWFSLVLGIFLVLWAVSGIVLNHRKTFSAWELSRNLLPNEYNFKNWNNASVRSGLQLGDDSLLIYGNIGIWLTDTEFSFFTPFMDGLPKGTDNRRIARLLKLPNGALYAATQRGLFVYNFSVGKWQKMLLPLHDERITDLSVQNGHLVVLSRSEIFLAQDTRLVPDFHKVILKPAINDDGKIGLFRTLWVIHSGELYGLPGKLIVDLFAILLIFFVVTGYIYFFFPKWIKNRKKKQQEVQALVKTNRFSIKWHNKLGLWLGWFLILTTLTGMFLRPPLLIAIGNARVGKIPFSTLSHPNSWHDRLRAIHWNAEDNYWLLATNDGLFALDSVLSATPFPFPYQPPLSVMGINVLEQRYGGNFLIGSFNGLFLWNPERGMVVDFITGEVPQRRSSAGSPIGRHLISGLITVKGKDLIYDYNYGLLNAKIEMPSQLIDTPMPLWNVALEVHTARIFQSLTGKLYILIIPMFGISTLLILISGLIIWFRRGNKSV